MITQRKTTPDVLGHIAIGLVAGFLSGLFGVGGGVVIVPLLVLLLRYDQRLATGTSLAAIAPTATVGVISYALDGDVAWVAALILAAGAVIGAQGGSWLLPRLPVAVLQLTFAVFMIVVILSLFFVIPSRADQFALTLQNSIFLIILGLLTGIISGLLGVGGGIIVVPALMMLLGTSDLIARGTSLLMMVPAAVSGTIGNIRRANVDLAGATLIAVSACTTTAIGSWLTKTMNPLTGNIVFAAFLMVIATQIVVRAIRKIRHQKQG